jgi:hypothetical protein
VTDIAQTLAAWSPGCGHRRPRLLINDAPIEVPARLMGDIQWVCPECAYIHGNEKVNFRHAKLVCNYRADPKSIKRTGSCYAKYLLGVGFSRPQDMKLRPPHNALVLHGLRKDLTNRVWHLSQDMAQGVPALARYCAGVEYRCPSCHTYQRQVIDPYGTVTCQNGDRCGELWVISVLLHRVNLATRLIRTPRDWSVSREYESE